MSLPLITPLEEHSQSILVSIKPQARVIEGRWGRLRPLDPVSDALAIHRLSHDDAVELTWREMKVGPHATFGLPKGLAANDVRIVAFVQEQKSRRIVGASQAAFPVRAP